MKRLKEKKERGEMSKSGFLESIKNLQQMPVIVRHDCRNHFNTDKMTLQQATGDILAAFGSENEFILSTMMFKNPPTEVCTQVLLSHCFLQCP